MIDHPCVGSYRLASFEARTPDGRSFVEHVENPALKAAFMLAGRIPSLPLPMNFAPSASVFYPFGPEARGTLIYTADGHYALTMFDGRRRGFGSEDLLSTTSRAKARALMTYMSAAGTYTVDGDRIAHRVESHLYPGEVGREHVFRLVFNGARTMVAEKPTEPSVVFGGKSMMSYAAWERL